MTPVKAFGEFKNEYNLMQDLLKKIILYSKTLFNNFLKQIIGDNWQIDTIVHELLDLIKFFDKLKLLWSMT